MWRDDMKYYELKDMDDPFPASSRVIDEDELNRRIGLIRNFSYNIYDAKQILLHGKVKPDPDPWEEWAEESSWAFFDGDGKQIKAALLKLKTLVEKKD
jgi:hypothetical protein